MDQQFQRTINTNLENPILSARTGAAPDSTGFPRTILVIDEHKTFCKRLRWAAQDYNSLIVYCNSMPSVSRLIEMDKFDLVLVSKEFCNYKGNVLSKFISKFFKDLPVIMLSCREDGYEDNSPLAPASVIGSIPRHFASNTILNKIGYIYSERFYRGFNSVEEEHGYTNFCDTKPKSPVVKSFLATFGKVLLANASLVIKK